ncbi:unnamed protein product [Urochloa humidicola]
MDPSERQGSQQKKLRKSLHTSGRSTGAPAVASSSCLGAAAGAFANGSGTTAPSSGGLGATAGAFVGSSGATAPSSGAGTGCHQSPSAFWTVLAAGCEVTLLELCAWSRIWHAGVQVHVKLPCTWSLDYYV